MAILKLDSKLTIVKEIPFKLEKEIQLLIENHLNSLLNLELIRSEFVLHNFRIDTLAFNKETNAFTIIEYKKDKSYSVIDQGYAYLALMLNNKADFILEYNEQEKGTLKRSDVDWSQSRVLFISPKFSHYQRQAINFKDLPIDLWEIKRFENHTISFEQIQNNATRESIKTISPKNGIEEVVNKEIKVYSEQEHLQKSSAETKELYQEVKTRICSFGDEVTIQPKKQVIGFKVNNNIFCDIVLQGKGLKIFLNLKSGELQDQKNISRDISNVGHWGNGSYEIKLSELEDIDYIMSLIKQALRKNQKGNNL